MSFCWCVKCCWCSKEDFSLEVPFEAGCVFGYVAGGIRWCANEFKAEPKDRFCQRWYNFAIGEVMEGKSGVIVELGDGCVGDVFDGVLEGGVSCV